MSRSVNSRLTMSISTSDNIVHTRAMSDFLICHFLAHFICILYTDMKEMEMIDGDIHTCQEVERFDEREGDWDCRPFPCVRYSTL